MLHTVHFLTDINVPSVRQLMDVCMNAVSNRENPATELKIFISSRGGETNSGFTAYNFLKSLPVKVKTHNLSNVESIANVMFMAGEERTANKLSRFLLHPLTWGFGTPQADHLRIREWTSCLDDDLERFVKILDLETQGFNLPHQHDWRELITSTTIADADRAAEVGLIHRVEEARLPAESIRWWVTT
ncbi:ATP-dependent Clp protease proteolytic subunit [Erwiniaceae bacterium L1_54_6]|nr:ATP-dependent Clp protease proteolytic subunit [Erwiniaceae bacterium L1_54_6]